MVMLRAFTPGRPSLRHGKIEQVKLCSRCKTKKPVDDFPVNRKKRDGRATYCSSCMKSYQADYYERTKARLNPVRGQQKRVHRAMLQEKIVEYLLDHPCVDCGETDVVVLQFDHLGDKIFNVGDAVSNCASWETVLSEIDKCEVVCANDHIRRTSHQFGYYRSRVASSTG